jgi:hypothetical protein
MTSEAPNYDTLPTSAPSAAPSSAPSRPSDPHHLCVVFSTIQYSLGCAIVYRHDNIVQVAITFSKLKFLLFFQKCHLRLYFFVCFDLQIRYEHLTRVYAAHTTKINHRITQDRRPIVQAEQIKLASVTHVVGLLLVCTVSLKRHKVSDRLRKSCLMMIFVMMSLPAMELDSRKASS